MSKRKMAQQLFEQQQERLRMMRLKEQENAATEDAKAIFKQKPYYLRPDRCGNDLGGRE